jgi:hypothetical protein
MRSDGRDAAVFLQRHEWPAAGRQGGIELPDAAAARREATKYAVDLVRKRAGLNAPDEVGNVVVTDERGAEVLTVTFPKSAVERCGT